MSGRGRSVIAQTLGTVEDLWCLLDFDRFVDFIPLDVKTIDRLVNRHIYKLKREFENIRSFLRYPKLPFKRQFGMYTEAQ